MKGKYIYFITKQTTQLTTMNTNALEYYTSLVCMKPAADSSYGSLCCQEKGHNGPCDTRPHLHLLNPHAFPQRYELENAIVKVLEFSKKQNNYNEKALAAMTFDLICYASTIEECRLHMSWEEEFDILRKNIFTHITRINCELKKIGLNLYNNKIIHCPVLGNNFTVSIFVLSLSSPENLIKSNTIICSENIPDLNYSGPYIIPISQRGLQFVGNYPLVHDPYTSENWRHELNIVVKFQHSI